MIVGLDVLLPRVKTGEIISGLSERELTNPEGAGFDVRAGEIYSVDSGGFLGISDRETPNVTRLGRYDANNVQTIELKSGQYYLVKIVEEFALGEDMIAIAHPRSTLFRSGVVLQTGVAQPGYHGAPTFGLYVAGAHSFRLELGARIAHVNFLRIEGSGRLYRGQWQGGRVTTDGRETQV